MFCGCFTVNDLRVVETLLDEYLTELKEHEPRFEFLPLGYRRQLVSYLDYVDSYKKALSQFLNENFPELPFDDSGDCALGADDFDYDDGSVPFES